ncbi:hypothetical protein OH768_49395 [Streptomyces sp. NBC_01622]|uniref:hypothetical protein n=1 Tax=Streptomyces sp. NBC_01622 TaxID=2975903 RepID=UPI00386B2F80|nr:hypothetical protein OH768_49395 [Streptomyces sp. NBC_01622]
MGKKAERELAAVGADGWLATVEPLGRSEAGAHRSDTARTTFRYPRDFMDAVLIVSGLPV